MPHSSHDAAADKTVTCDIKGATARVTLRRPSVHNALDTASIARLTAVFKSMPEEVRIIVLSGEGKSFCAGADLKDMQQSVHQTPQQNRADAEALSQMFATVAEAPQVVMASVQGAALGGGAGLVSCCDLVVADTHARFGFTEARLGLAPAVIAPHVVRRIGYAQAKRAFLTAEIVDSQTALGMGLVDSVVGKDACETMIDAWQTLVLRNGPKALTRIKALLRELSRATPNVGTALCIDTISEMRASAEGQAGVFSFLQKKVPPWRAP